MSAQRKPKNSSTKLQLDLGDNSHKAPTEVYVPARIVPWGAIKDRKGQPLTLASTSVGCFMAYNTPEEILAEFGPDERYWTLARPQPIVPPSQPVKKKTTRKKVNDKKTRKTKRGKN